MAGDNKLTREQKRRMFELLEQAALHDYPNPDRVGCPGVDFLKRLAADRELISLKDESLTHVARCSPCYREFAAFRADIRKRRVTRRGALAVAGLVTTGVAAFAVRWSNPSDNKAGGFQSAELNLSNDGGTRGQAPESAQSLKELPHKKIDLKIELPFASPEGDYEVQILRSDGAPTGLRASGQTHLVEGSAVLRVRLDLTGLKPDEYRVGIRRVPFDWIPVSVRVR